MGPEEPYGAGSIEGSYLTDGSNKLILFPYLVHQTLIYLILFLFV